MNEWTETLKDGKRALVRPIRRDDVERNTRFLDELSPASKHFLFLGGVARLTDEALRKLCAPDYSSDMAFVALDAGSEDAPRQVGVCRYAGADSPTAPRSRSPSPTTGSTSGSASGSCTA